MSNISFCSAKFSLTAVFFGLATSALAMDSKNFYLDASGSLGYSKPTIISSQSAPTMMQWGIGITGGYSLMENFFAGVSSDFRYVGQYSEVSTTVGNFRGTRWNYVSPTFGAKIMNIQVKADFQFLGNYNLSNTDGSGGSVSYKKPLGGRVVALYPVMQKIHVGSIVELLTYGSQSTSSTGDKNLSSRLKFWQFGLTAGYVF